ncbi:uncharacterized protein MONBRDRAFT_10860 [Monosiga brevicollis MX1]|uniref:USP domain-containing protein n=1 Tax=Monosiga brevicollis TaxID=81824 RepID=A9V7G1_MONBE|nr:uncharacterized protein MONBRDRAFT_10860 [Monosiga brevicollis MX1]EDQ86580.1 predicted protein [Monosiga brevicollis MX1]|eukprot:XP_001748693.1 hypothetical protein [Monosiga brevicollis MX1]
MVVAEQSGRRVPFPAAATATSTTSTTSSVTTAVVGKSGCTATGEGTAWRRRSSGGREAGSFGSQVGAEAPLWRRSGAGLEHNKPRRRHRRSRRGAQHASSSTAPATVAIKASDIDAAAASPTITAAAACSPGLSGSYSQALQRAQPRFYVAASSPLSCSTSAMNTGLPQDDGAEPAAPTQAQQQRLYDEAFIKKDDWKTGMECVLLPFVWHRALTEFLAGKTSMPPASPIPMSSLMDAKTRKLQAQAFAAEVNLEAFSLLRSWYGVDDPAAIFVCPVYLDANNRPKVETHPLKFRVAAVTDNDNIQSKLQDLSISRLKTVTDLKAAILDQFDVPGTVEARLWEYQARQCSSSGQTVAAVPSYNSSGGISSTSYANGTGSGYGPGSTLTNRSYGYSSNYGTSTYGGSYGRASNKPILPGRTGLRNLGNTCFMNSALQCLSHCADLRQFFLSGRWQQDLNKNNPIGCDGHLAEAYAELLEKLWSATQADVSPWHLKDTISKFAPQFSGYQQHDSQELTAFLLDGLHEDLNRIQKKPFVEAKEAEGEDVTAAREAWTRHLLRNDSIIVDLFQGQIKSTLNCPECNKISVTFDPMMYLSVPIPELDTTFFTITVVFADPRRAPAKCTVELPAKSGTMREMIAAVAEETAVEPRSLVATDLYHSRFYKIFDGHDTMGNITNGDDVAIFEVPPLEGASWSDEVIPVYHMRQGRAFTSSYYSTSYAAAMETTGFPFLIRPGPDTTGRQLLAAIADKASQYYAPSHPESSDEEDASEGQNEDAPSMDTREDAEDSDDEFDRELQANVQAANAPAQGNETSKVVEKAAAPFKSQPPRPAVTELFEVYSSESRTSTYSRLGPSLDLDTDEPVDIKRHVIQLYWEREDAENLLSTEAVLTQAESAPSHVSYTAARKNKHNNVDERDAASVSLRECVERYIQKERLTADNTCFYRDKIDTLVEFPLEGLDMSPYVLSPKHREGAIYDCFAVSNHSGGYGGGHLLTDAGYWMRHYIDTAYALDESGAWCDYDDAWVTPMRTNQIVTTESYMLFYRRRKTLSCHAVTGQPLTVPGTPAKVEEADDDMDEAGDDLSTDNLV